MSFQERPKQPIGAQVPSGGTEAVNQSAAVGKIPSAGTQAANHSSSPPHLRERQLCSDWLRCRHGLSARRFLSQETKMAWELLRWGGKGRCAGGG